MRSNALKGDLFTTAARPYAGAEEDENGESPGESNGSC